jgi:hypothetical protein
LFRKSLSRSSDACLRVHRVDLEEITFGTRVVRLLAEAEVLDRVLAEKEFESPYWDWYDCPGSGSSEFPSELQPGCARWKAFQRLRLVSKGVRAVVKALPEFRHTNKMRQLRQALHERHQVGKLMMAGGPCCMPIDVAL